MIDLGIEESDTSTTLTDENDLREVDEIIMIASKELQRVAEENQELLGLLEKNPETSKGRKPDDFDSNLMKQLEEAEQDAKDTANKIYELKTRVGELLKKEELTEEETRELDLKNNELKEQMKFFEKRTKDIQFLINKSNFVNQIPEGQKAKVVPFPRKIPCETDESSMTKTTIGDGSRIGCCSCCSENSRKNRNVPTFAKKLSQSYTMQEKLAAENADLESVRFKLQEELLNKDQTLECLQREMSNLQNEMKVLTRENVTLNEKLKKMQGDEYQEETITKTHQKPIITSKKLQQYSDNTYELEKQLRDMENDIKCLHEEICAVQREREHLEKHRKMMIMPKTCQGQHVISSFNVPAIYSNHPHPLKKAVPPTQLIKELFNQYDKLENDLKFKISNVLALNGDYEKLKKLTTEAEEYKKNSLEMVKECENIINRAKMENESSLEKEKILDAKKRLKKAEDLLKEEQQLINDQKQLVEDITSKFIEAQNQLKEQKHNLDYKFVNQMSTSPGLGSQIVTSLHDKLEEISI